MSNVRFTEDHEWVRMEDDDVGVCGITDYAQEQLGEIVFVELPEVGSDIEQGNDAAVIESVKAAGELKSPVSGTVAEVNSALADEPEKVNKDAMGDGWIVKLRITDKKQLESLMDADAYNEYVKGLG